MNAEIGSLAVCEAIETTPSMTTVDIANIIAALRLRVSMTPLQQQGRADCDKVLGVAHGAIMIIWTDEKQ